jgi:hypothetical protein
LGVLLLGVAACPRSAPPEIDYTAPPRLPAPEAGVYDRYATTSSDPVVASVVGARALDAYLSGAAAGLALAAVEGDETLDSWEVREAAWRAGYAYPVEGVQRFTGPSKAPPPPEVQAWLATVDPETDLGLVRARNAQVETWIGLAATPRIDLGTQPRLVVVGDVMTLPSVRGGRYQVAAPDGDVRAGPLDTPTRVQLDLDGEWLFQVLLEDDPAATFPVYADTDPPRRNLLPSRAHPVADAAEAEEVTADLLASIRDAYGLARWTRDTILDACAQRLLAEPGANTKTVLASLGITDPVHSWSCSASVVEACLDKVVWEPSERTALLSGDYTYFGVAAATGAGKVRIRVVLSGE